MAETSAHVNVTVAVGEDDKQGGVLAARTSQHRWSRWAQAAVLLGVSAGSAGTAAAQTWITENVFGPSDSGRSASLGQERHRCSGDGVQTICHTIGVAFLDEANNQLVFAISYNEGQSFAYNIVDGPNDGASVDGHISLTYNASTPVISYHDATTNRLKVAKRVTVGTGNCGSGLQWKCRTLQPGGLHTSVDVDGAFIYISHVKSSGSLALSKSRVDFTGEKTEQVFTNGTVKSTTLKFDGLHRPHLAWSDGTCIRYMWNLFEGDELIECSPAGAGLNVARIDMTVAANHIPHVSYSLRQATGSTRVRHGFKLSTDSPDWEIEPVATMAAPSQPVPNIVDTSIVLNAELDDVGAIAWGNRTIVGVDSVWKLFINYPTGTPAWTSLSIVDTTGGQNSSMIRLPDGTLGIAHYYPTDKNLRYSRED